MAPSTIRRHGMVTPADQLTRKLVAFDVPVGTTSIDIEYRYSGREDGNAIDLGLFGVDEQFRGYSGGARFAITVANDEATPGYIPGLLAPGEWYVMLGIYQIKSESVAYDIEVTLDDKPRPDWRSQPAPSRASYSGVMRQPPGRRPTCTWLKGDFHVHSVYSDGKMTMEEIIEKAQKRGLDFLFSTEHNTYSANQVWGRHVPEGFLVGRGMEVTTHEGHWNAIGLLPEQMIDPTIADPRDKDASLVKAATEVHMCDGFAIINHPYAECPCCAWTFSFDEHMDAIEVWNGPWKRHAEDESNVRAVQKWDALLRDGRVFTASGGSDIHEARFEIGEPVTRVLADENSVGAIIRGLRARRAYMTQHPAYEMQFILRCGDATAGIGDWIESKGEMTLEVTLTGFPESEASVVTEKGVVYRTLERCLSQPVEGKYVRIEVRDMQDNMLGLTNPIWIL